MYIECNSSYGIDLCMRLYFKSDATQYIIPPFQSILNSLYYLLLILIAGTNIGV